MSSSQNLADRPPDLDDPLWDLRSQELWVWLLIGIFDGALVGYRIYSVRDQGPLDPDVLTWLLPMQWFAMGLVIAYLTWWYGSSLRWPLAVLYTGVSVWLAIDAVFPNALSLDDDFSQAAEWCWLGSGVIGVVIYLRRVHRLQFSVGAALYVYVWCWILGPIMLVWSLTPIAYRPLMFVRFDRRKIRNEEEAGPWQSLWIEVVSLSPVFWIVFCFVAAGINIVNRAIGPLLVTGGLFVFGSLLFMGVFIRAYPPPIRLLLGILGVAFAAAGFVPR